jgi:hypothetical protein
MKIVMMMMMMMMMMSVVISTARMPSDRPLHPLEQVRLTAFTDARLELAPSLPPPSNGAYDDHDRDDGAGDDTAAYQVSKA